MNTDITSPGMVYALGEGSQPAARLYSSLTGREWSVYEGTGMPAGLNDVIVCTTGYLTSQLMHNLYVSGNGAGAPGILCAPTPAELEQVCRRQALKLMPPQSRNVRRVFAYPLMNFPTIYRGDDIFVSGAESIETLQRLLSSHAAVLCIHTFSDGIDFVLSDRHFACPFSSPPAGNELLPFCQVEGKCKRMLPAKPRIADAWQTGSLVPLSTLSARIVILCACNTVRLVDGVMDPAYGIAPALLRQADLGVLITFWRSEYMISDRAYLNKFINELCAGVQVGVAVKTFNSSDHAARLGLKFCVIGDPSFALPADQGFVSLPTGLPAVPENGPAIQIGERSMREKALLLKDAVATAVRLVRRFDAVKGKRLAASLMSYAQAQPNQDSSGQQEIGNLDRAILDFLAPAPWLDKFRPQYEVTDMREDGICPSCFSPSRTFRKVFPSHPGAPWQTILCAACGEYTFPEHWNLALDLSDLGKRCVTVSGIPAGGSVLFSLNDVYCFHDSFHRADGVSVGEGKYSFTIPPGLPSIPIRCNVLVACQLEIGCIGFTFTSSSNGTLSTARLALSASFDSSPTTRHVCEDVHLPERHYSSPLSF